MWKRGNQVKYNYHTHTTRCHHAIGTVEEYIKKAVENGMTHMGFSDHVPLMFSDGTESGYRVSVREAGDYIQEISEIREKYKDKIDIKIGFEMEYYPELFEKMLADVKGYGAEYLILGAHFLGPENEGSPYAYAENKDVTLLKKYVDVVIEGMKTGAFTYLAHPDIIAFLGDEDVYAAEMRRLCKASAELKIPLEINFLGIRDNRLYPRGIFWKMAGEELSPVTFGLDAHRSEDAYDEKSFLVAMEMVEKFGLNYIGRPEIINI